MVPSPDLNNAPSTLKGLRSCRSAQSALLKVHALAIREKRHVQKRASGFVTNLTTIAGMRYCTRSALGVPSQRVTILMRS